MAIVLQIKSNKLIDDAIVVGDCIISLRSNGSRSCVIVDPYYNAGNNHKKLERKQSDQIYYKLNREMPSIFNAIRLWATLVTEMSVQEFVERMLGDDFRNYSRLFRGRSGVAWSSSKNPFTRAFWKSRAIKF